MNKTELVAAMADKAGLTKKDADAALKAFTEVVEETLKAGDSIQLIGFGTFEVAERAERTGRNPQKWLFQHLKRQNSKLGKLLKML